MKICEIIANNISASAAARLASYWQPAVAAGQLAACWPSCSEPAGVSAGARLWPVSRRKPSICSSLSWRQLMAAAARQSNNGCGWRKYGWLSRHNQRLRKWRSGCINSENHEMKCSSAWQSISKSGRNVAKMSKSYLGNGGKAA